MTAMLSPWDDRSNRHSVWGFFDCRCDVLICDDEANIRLPLKRVLEIRFPGRRVEVAANGVDAALRLSRLRPTIVLLDLVMPGFDGWLLYDHVQRDPDLSPTRFICISGRIDQGTVDRAAARQVPFLLKPFDFPELFDLIEARLAPGEARGLKSAHPPTPRQKHDILR